MSKQDIGGVPVRPPRDGWGKLGEEKALLCAAMSSGCIDCKESCIN